MIDSHAHIFTSEFDDDLAETVGRARDSGVEKILMPNIDCDTIDRLDRVYKRFPETCLPMMGLHPCSVKEDYREQLDVVKQNLESGGYVAVGEMGTDLYWDKSHWEEQQDAFLTQAQWAVELDLPIVIHCRESLAQTIELLRNAGLNGLCGVFHCFTGNLRQAQDIMDMGFYMGVGGVITFKNGGMEPVFREIPIDFLLLETDSPYLSPAPHRGKRNEPGRLIEISQKLAEVKQMDISEVRKVTAANTRKLFRLEK